MESLASISGLATGIDFRALVDQIIEVESSRLDYLRVQVSDRRAEEAAWEQVRTLLQSIETAGEGLADGEALDVFTAEVLGLNPGILGVTAGADAVPGRHQVRVFQAAQREVMGSSLQASRTDGLGTAGQFIIGGRAVEVAADDSLLDIAGRINSLNTGADPIGVSATVVGSEGAFRLVLSASDTGAEGLGLLDTSGVLADLGFFDGTTVLKNRTSGGFASDALSDSDTAVGSLLGFSGTQPSGTVTLGAGGSAFTVALDLGSQSLTDIRDAINTAAAGAGSSMFATIVSDADGFSLDVTGTAAATDGGGVLQALGILEGNRSDVSQVVQGDILTSDGSTPATASTSLLTLYNGASPAGATVGDTIQFNGVNNDGATFSFTHTIGAADTLQTLITRLEGSEGFNGGATVEVSAEGRLTATSTVAGSSLLSLESFAGNEGGGILDLGTFSVSTEGREREVTAGQDAIVEIDGALVRSSSNDISDVVAGVTFNVLAADPTGTLEVVIERNEEAGVEAVQAFVDAVNELLAFVDAGAGVVGDARPALAGDSLLRGIRDQINFALQATVPVGANGSTRLADLGIEITRDGVYTLDTETLTAALQQDPAAVRSVLSSYGSSTSASITYIGAGTSTSPGTYSVDITQAATLASVTSSGFGGTYVDDGTADTISITHLASGNVFQTSLVNGMTLDQIIDAMNAEFDRESNQVLTSERTMYGDGGGASPATAGTALADLYHGAGQSSGFVAGTELTFSGTDPNGGTVLETFTVTDPSTQTLGDVRAALQSAFGAGVSVSIAGGQLVVTDTDAGDSQLAVNIGADIGGNAAPFGLIEVTSEGREGVGISASNQAGELSIRSDSYGSANDFSVSFTGGGSNGSASLGLAAGTYSGVDVIGTIGGEAATGIGNTLTADTGTTAAGLTVRVGGAGTGYIGDVTFGRGVVSSAAGVLDILLDTGEGSIDGIIKRLGETIERTEDRLFDREERLEVRREQLLAQFIALEQAIARSQSQQERLAAQIASLPGSNSGSS